MIVFKEYLYEIFNIMKENEVNIDVAIDMFVRNISEGKNCFKKNDRNFKYNKLSKEYNNMSNREIINALASLKTFLEERKTDLCRIFSNGTKEEFELLCGITPVTEKEIKNVLIEENKEDYIV